MTAVVAVTQPGPSVGEGWEGGKRVLKTRLNKRVLFLSDYIQNLLYVDVLERIIARNKYVSQFWFFFLQPYYFFFNTIAGDIPVKGAWQAKQSVSNAACSGMSFPTRPFCLQRIMGINVLKIIFFVKRILLNGWGSREPPLSLLTGIMAIDYS